MLEQTSTGSGVSLQLDELAWRSQGAGTVLFRIKTARKLVVGVGGREHAIHISSPR